MLQLFAGQWKEPVNYHPFLPGWAMMVHPMRRELGSLNDKGHLVEDERRLQFASENFARLEVHVLCNACA